MTPRVASKAQTAFTLGVFVTKSDWFTNLGNRFLVAALHRQVSNSPDATGSPWTSLRTGSIPARFQHLMIADRIPQLAPSHLLQMNGDVHQEYGLHLAIIRYFRPGRL